MSDPVTNVDIEDVLSSIRRLVSDGDKARTRDPASTAAVTDPAPEAPKENAPEAESKPDRFVLTPALMVVANDSVEELSKNSADDEGEADQYDEDDQDAGWVEELPDEPETAHSDVIHHDDAAGMGEPQSDFEADHAGEDVHARSLADDETSESDSAIDEDDGELADPAASDPDEEDGSTEMVWGSVDEARKIGLAAVPDVVKEKENSSKRTDRSGLIASIAELEAAISKDAHDFEPDGSEDADVVVGETIAWPGKTKRNTENAPDAEESEKTDIDLSEEDEPAQDEPDAHETNADQADDVESIAFEHRAAATLEGEQDTAETPVDDTDDDFGNDDLDGLLDAGSLNLDEDALRALVSEIVREELTGPMGERITRNVRKLVRREIYRILSSQEFD